MKISRQSLLSLDFDLASNEHTVRIHPDILHSFDSWSSHTRVSPIWLYGDKTKSAPAGLEPSDVGLAFIANTNPASFVAHFGRDFLDGPEIGNVWVSLGSFNLIVVLKEENGAALIEEFCRSVSSTYELWTFKPADYDITNRSHTVGLMDFYPATVQSSTSSVEPIAKEIDQTEPHFQSILVELTALLSMAIKRSANQLPNLTKDFEVLAEAAFNFLIERPALRKKSGFGEPEKTRVLSGLQNINAGLSRLTSQALSGASPIAKTECHFWPHSLLGIGIANTGLRNIVAYISDIFEEFSFSDRTSLLLSTASQSEKATNDVPFAELAGFFPLDQIKPDARQRTMIPITYFSGRDGFKNSTFTTSAPLMSIQAGNAYEYSLVTITHEISHRIVAATIAKMLKPYDGNTPSYDKIISEISTPNRAHGALFFQNYILALVNIALENHAVDPDWQSNVDFLDTIILDFGEEFEEHLVHVFDFWYFFDRNYSRYITAIWCSWAVIPNIAARIEEYVVRTLIALSSNNVTKTDWVGESVAEMLTVFEELKARDALHLADEVIDLLTDKERLDEIVQRVHARQNVIRVFHSIFKSEILAGKLAEEPLPGKRPAKRSRDLKKGEQKYNFREREFSVSKFGNAIKFLKQYAADDKAQPNKSAWVLLMLAFNMYRSREHG
ncbi:hypothetical protein GR217_37160 [Rhizobium leguminosarum]|uniref:Uncharacterized protein n=1 Tax=Rhizobium ruizarguesonis TaxID=2081791 RepID=A0AAE5C694_9HYPH|nr:hypothetical protein [Rhizobium ruizarguesonis]NEI53219.1 hypothetical protein [Rhizobium ruizarguesonis]